TSRMPGGATAPRPGRPALPSAGRPHGRVLAPGERGRALLRRRPAPRKEGPRRMGGTLRNGPGLPPPEPRSAGPRPSTRSRGDRGAAGAVAVLGRRAGQRDHTADLSPPSVKGEADGWQEKDGWQEEEEDRQETRGQEARRQEEEGARG